MADYMTETGVKCDNLSYFIGMARFWYYDK